MHWLSSIFFLDMDNFYDYGIDCFSGSEVRVKMCIRLFRSVLISYFLVFIYSVGFPELILKHYTNNSEPLSATDLHSPSDGSKFRIAYQVKLVAYFITFECQWHHCHWFICVV